MDIRSVLVNVDLTNTALPYAVSLATAFGATLTGLAADEPSLALGGIEGSQVAMDYYAVERQAIESGIAEAEARFRAAAGTGLKTEWRGRIGNATGALLDAALGADLLVTGRTNLSMLGEQRLADIGQLVLGSGRPVLAVGEGSSSFSADRIVIGWKDTREARRAVADALPFLRRASAVVAITISEDAPSIERSSQAQLLAWLAMHGVMAHSELIESDAGFIDVLESTARAYRADLVVTGGYGHSRMREWLFGGMTKNLIEAGTLNRLFSN